MAIPSPPVGSQGCEKIFLNKKFFLLQKIPDRSHIKELITKRGGEVVKVEEQADLIIADHNGKFAPPRSVSWTYIRDSDERGYLQDVNDHLAGPTSFCAPRSITKQFKQSTRTGFSNEDDRFLYKSCLSAEKKGIKTNGNKFYQKLEQMSWRDRWIKKGPFLKQKYSNETACENIAGDHHSTGNLPNVTEIQHQLELEQNFRTPKKSPITNQDVIKNPGLKHSDLEIKIPQDQIIVSPGGEFTQYETNLLLDAYTDIMEVDEAQIIAAWMAWAHEEWRNYFMEYVKPMCDRNSSGPMEISTNLEATASPRALSDQSLAINVYAQTKNQEDTYPQRTPGSNRSYNSKILEEEHLKKAVERIATKLHLLFNENLKICGRKIPLPEIWKIAQLPEFGGLDKINEHNLWYSIAKKLGFNSRDTAAANELSYCYHEILTRLGKDPVQSGFTTDSEKNNEEVIYTNQKTYMEEIGKSEGRIIQVPIQGLEKSDGNSLKRRINQRSKLQKHAEMKRRRVNDDKDASLEVPATPEEKINASSSALLFDGKLSPVNQLSLGSFEKNENKFISPSDKPINLNRRLDFRASNSRFVSPSEIHDVDQEAQYSLIPLVSNQECGTKSKLVSGKHYKNLVTQKNEFANEARKDSSSPCLDNSKNYESQSLGTEDDFGQQLSGKQKSSIPLLKPCQNRDSSICSQGRSHDNLITCTLQNTTNDVPEERNRDLLQEFITDQVIGLGFPQDVIIEALEATSMKIGLESHIQQVMDSLLNGDGIPNNLSGVWTLDDDKALKEQPRGKEYERIVKKHGKEKIKLRHQFWIDMEDADDADGTG
ncbi:hypothetical protein BGHDH14_bgh03313 [Blumeria hordei DH14]|uniref:DNA-binding protein RAP1 n=1 Tax=Blumeria graminis f. sp. hordei (strain DH14) TaxID=546991 RepID=N1JJ21_BLUG1|nr:hypothetical protein BGHDH14_bgh03313 [Blumeria hordei DH14]